MRRSGPRIASAVLFLCALAGTQAPARGQGVPLPVEDLPLAKDIEVTSGQTVTPVFEGWYTNPDGTYSLSFGYYSRNSEEEVHIPIGPDNELTGVDQVVGQPTDFEPGRHWGVFVAQVPADFQGEVVWKLKDRGEVFEIPGSLNPLWEIDAISGDAMGNHPPSIRFSENGPAAQGPAGIEAPKMTASVGEPIHLTIWGRDDGVTESLGATDMPARPFTVHWFTQAGPADASFTAVDGRIPVEGGSASTTASFSVPGTYVLRVTANDASGVVGGGQSQCCWTNGFVEVTVTPDQGRAP